MTSTGKLPRLLVLSSQSNCKQAQLFTNNMMTTRRATVTPVKSINLQLVRTEGLD
jgi:hypothetical protein